MSEEIGKHKGAVETLLHEKKELSRLLQIVNSQLERHLSALQEAGVDTDKYIDDIQQQNNTENRDKNRKRQQNNQSNRRQQKQRKNKKKRQEQTSNQRDTEDRDFNPL